MVQSRKQPKPILHYALGFCCTKPTFLLPLSEHIQQCHPMQQCDSRAIPCSHCPVLSSFPSHTQQCLGQCQHDPQQWSSSADASKKEASNYTLQNVLITKPLEKNDEIIWNPPTRTTYSCTTTLAVSADLQREFRAYSAAGLSTAQLHKSKAAHVQPRQKNFLIQKPVKNKPAAYCKQKPTDRYLLAWVYLSTTVIKFKYLYRKMENS